MSEPLVCPECENHEYLVLQETVTQMGAFSGTVDKNGDVQIHDMLDNEILEQELDFFKCTKCDITFDEGDVYKYFQSED